MPSQEVPPQPTSGLILPKVRTSESDESGLFAGVQTTGPGTDVPLNAELCHAVCGSCTGHMAASLGPYSDPVEEHAVEEPGLLHKKNHV